MSGSETKLGEDALKDASTEEAPTKEAIPINAPFRTQLVQVLGAPWGCYACNAKGMVFDSHKLKELQVKNEFNMECPNCKAVIHLVISKILIPQTNARPSKPLIHGV